MSAPAMPLLSNWQAAWASMRGPAPAAGLYDELCAAWSEPQRHYHTLRHLTECLAALETFSDLATHPAELGLALWFHDAIYDVHAHDNELRSAEWAALALREAGISPAACARVHDLILATQHAATPSSPDACLLVDIDLLILAAAPARFAEYEAQVRAEYAWVPETEFRQARSRILQSFVARQQIYQCAPVRQHYEAAARANLKASISRLTPVD